MRFIPSSEKCIDAAFCVRFNAAMRHLLMTRPELKLPIAEQHRVAIDELPEGGATMTIIGKGPTDFQTCETYELAVQIGRDKMDEMFRFAFPEAPMIGCKYRYPKQGKKPAKPPLISPPVLNSPWVWKDSELHIEQIRHLNKDLPVDISDPQNNRAFRIRLARDVYQWPVFVNLPAPEEVLTREMVVMRSGPIPGMTETIAVSAERLREIGKTDETMSPEERQERKEIFDYTQASIEEVTQARPVLYGEIAQANLLKKMLQLSVRFRDIPPMEITPSDLAMAAQVSKIVKDCSPIRGKETIRERVTTRKSLLHPSVINGTVELPPVSES